MLAVVDRADRQPKTTKPRSTRLNRENGQRGDLGGISSLERLTEWDSLERPEGRLLAHPGSTPSVGFVEI